MIRYVKGPAPARLTSLTATPGIDWDGLGADDKQPLREALVRDQGALCAYCQRRIAAAIEPATGRSRMKIEHWAARSDHGEDRQLAWSNLLGVCLGGAPATSDAGPSPIVRHCDESRGARPLFLHPVDGQGPDPRTHLRYGKDGNVEPAPDARVEADIVALNLRAARLRRGRAAVLDALWDRLRREDFSTAALRRVARQHRIVAGETAPEHAEFVRYHVLRKLRQRGEAE